jgi:hypothetical protein
MRGHHWLLALALGVGVLGLVRAAAAESAEAARIAKLIEQLGSGNFEEREKATAALEAVGLPALEPLRKAAAGDDAEVKRRAGELVRKLEKKAEVARVLAPKKVHLVYKDTPLAEAVADFAKKSGYPINLHDPENKLKDRTVSLDTGETTFWHALDLFCRAAGLSEATPQDLIQKSPPIRPLPPRPIGAPGILPVVPPPAGAPGIPARNPPPAREGKPGAALREEARPLPPAKPVPPAPPPAPVAPPAVRILPANVAVAAPMIRTIGFNQGEITLVDRKSEAVPTDDSSAIRVRLSQQPFVGKPADGREIRLWLEVTPEPRLRWQNSTAVRIDKAVDDQDQKLAQGETTPPGAVGVGVVGPGVMRPHIRFAVPPNLVSVQLKKGDKESKSLKELSGTITANLLTDVKDFIAVGKVLEAAGKMVKGTEGGSIQVTEVTKGDNDQVTITFELEQPSGVVAESNPRIVVPRPQPVQPPTPPVAAPGGAAPANPAAPAPPPPAGAGPAVQVKVGVGVAGPGIAVAPGGRVAFPLFTGPFNGIALLDDRDNILPVQLQQQRFRVAAGGGPTTMGFQIVYKPEKGQPAPAKLVFKGRKSVTIDVPFTLKDVPLP